MRPRLSLLLAALRELGMKPLALYAAYQAGLHSGLWRYLTQYQPEAETYPFHSCMTHPAGDQIRAILAPAEVEQVIREADLLIEKGLYAIFGGEPVPLQLAPLPHTLLKHWTVYERGQTDLPVEDIKFIWEPARMGWGFLLARAFLVTGEERYRQHFWRLLRDFLEHNPPMLGPNWSSGQEAAIRIMVMVWVGGLFLVDDPDEEIHAKLLSETIIIHAQRIPPTLIYARSQQNNHLITEALGLLAAGKAIPGHPEAKKWVRTGVRWLNDAFKNQIAATGEYAQHSMNYHRLMLQCACMAAVLLKDTVPGLTPEAVKSLQAATTWLAAETDGTTGQAANYGNNDGAYLFPADTGRFGDFRMTVQAAARTFNGQAVYPSGHWDEFSLWLGLSVEGGSASPAVFVKPEGIMKLGSVDTWARMRGNYFTSRPAHADQLHVDLWWKGAPIALDAGTYLYNGNPPWDNRLGGTAVHNTITVDMLDQMRRAGRFLWLDWAQACTMRPDPSQDYVQGEQNGYRKLHVMHRRRLESPKETTGWLVQDHLYQPRSFTEEATHMVRLHWLLPDGVWELMGSTLHMEVVQGKFSVTVNSDDEQQPMIQICRGGEVLSGGGTCTPQMGWHSPHYGEKLPAISFSVTYQTKFPITIFTKWLLSG